MKNPPSVSADHPEIVKIIKLCEKTAADNSWAIKDVVRVVGDVLVPKAVRVKGVKTGEKAS